jgi:L-asparaginase
MLSRTYGGIGSETNLIRDSGLYSAGSLSPLKARLKLLFGLSSGYSAEQLFITDNSN